jgi:hypothetical protein
MVLRPVLDHHTPKLPFLGSGRILIWQASLAGWQWILSRVRRGGVQREVPQDFKGAMWSLWNEERVNGPR